MYSLIRPLGCRALQNIRLGLMYPREHDLPARMRPVALAIRMFVHIGPAGGNPGESLGNEMLMASSAMLGGFPVAAARRLNHLLVMILHYHQDPYLSCM